MEHPGRLPGGGDSWGLSVRYLGEGTRPRNSQVRSEGTGAAGQWMGDRRSQGWTPKRAWPGPREEEAGGGQAGGMLGGRGLAREGNGGKGASASSAPCGAPHCVPCGLNLQRENLPAVSLSLSPLFRGTLKPTPHPHSALS